MPHCIVCEKPSAHHCLGCQASYCSTACQHEDYPLHRWLCKPFAKKYQLSQRPTANHVRCLTLPLRTTKPKWIWWDPGVAGAIEDFFDFADPSDEIEFAPVGREIGCVYTDADSEVTVLYRSQGTPLLEPDQVNKCLLTFGPPGHIFAKKGRIMCATFSPACLVEKRVPTRQHWRDFSLDDFRRAVDYLQWNSRNAAVCIERFPARLGPLVPGIKLNCAKDVDTLGLPHMEVVHMRGNQAWPLGTHVLAATARLGCALICCYFPSQNHILFGFNTGEWLCGLTNDMVSHLMMESPVDSEGLMHMDTQAVAGNVVLVRKDQKPLREAHVKAMYDFLRWVRRMPGMSKAYDPGEKIVSIDAAKYRAVNTKENFAKYWATYDIVKTEGKAIESPFE